MPSSDEPDLRGRQALLADVLIGVRDRHDPDVVAAGADPRFAQLLASLLRVQGNLDRLAADQRAALAEPGLPRDAALVALVRQRLRRRQPWHLRVLGLAVAAVLVLAAAGQLLFGGGGVGPASSYERLNAQAITCEPGYSAIGWQAATAASRYRVRVSTPTADGAVAEVEVSPLLDGNRWQPQQRALFGDWIRVEVSIPGIEEDRVLYRAEFLRSGQPR